MELFIQGNGCPCTPAREYWTEPPMWVWEENNIEQTLLDKEGTYYCHCPGCKSTYVLQVVEIKAPDDEHIRRVRRRVEDALRKSDFRTIWKVAGEMNLNLK